MIDYRLKIFLIVAEHLSFSKAAEEIHISQPPISKHINQLENHFKQKLFERKGNSIMLTTVGRTLLIHAKNIAVLSEELHYHMRRLLDKNEGVLRIAASTTIAQYILPMILPFSS